MFLLGIWYVATDHGSEIVVHDLTVLVQAHVCVSTTARQGAQLGYDVVLAEDAIGDRDIPGVSAEDVTKVALNEIADAFGTVVKSSDIK